MDNGTNKLIVYKRALENACDENNILRNEITKLRRETQQLMLENEDMRHAIIELSQHIELPSDDYSDDCFH
jgi:regulator of replication initiation timing